MKFVSRSDQAERVADLIAIQLRNAIAARGSARLAVSGGSTPAALYEALSERALRWRDVAIVLVDDRWVAPGKAGSNEDFVRNSLLQNEAAQARLTGLWSEKPSPRDGIEFAERQLPFGKLAIDVVVLGMGLDGHTASWFPHAEGLAEALSDDRRVAAVTAVESAVTGAHLERITLTLGAVSKAQHIWLMITGDEKRAVLERALADGADEEMPVRAIFRARPDLTTAWAP